MPSFKTGDFVKIVHRIKERYDRQKTRTNTHKVYGRIIKMESPDEALVVYCGQPSHFSPRGAKVARTSMKFNVDMLEHREPEEGDPNEFWFQHESARFDERDDDGE